MIPGRGPRALPALRNPRQDACRAAGCGRSRDEISRGVGGTPRHAGEVGRRRPPGDCATRKPGGSELRGSGWRPLPRAIIDSVSTGRCLFAILQIRVFADNLNQMAFIRQARATRRLHSWNC
jgi:hypothetical protein